MSELRISVDDDGTQVVIQGNGQSLLINRNTLGQRHDGEDYSEFAPTVSWSDLVAALLLLKQEET